MTMLLIVLGALLIAAAWLPPIAASLRSGARSEGPPQPVGHYERFRQFAARHEPVVRIVQTIVGAGLLVVGVLRLIV